MSTNKKGTNTSIELVSNSGPLPINVMMQEGVKALTKILSNQLQDRKAFENAQHSMQFVIRNNGRQFVGDATPEDSNQIDDNLDTDDELINQGNGNNTKKNNTTNKNSNNEIDSKNRSQVHEFMDEDFLNPDLHLDGEEAEIIFDYETQDDSPDAIGKRISEMIESVLPDGFTADAQGKLHAVINGNKLNITELDDNELPSQGGKFEFINGSNDQNKIEEIGNDSNHQYQINANIDLNGLINGDNEIIDEDDEDIEDEEDEDLDHDINDDSYEHDSCCPHHGSSGHRNPQRFKNHNFHDFDYIPRNIGSKRPDFSRLIEEDKSMCMFCEYYMVFGEPPKNMIKWYNNMYGYNRLPPSANKERHQHNHHHQQGQRKRNR